MPIATSYADSRFPSVSSSSDTQYIYLDFDGEKTRYKNADLCLDFAVTVEDSGFSEEQKQYILSELAAKYADADVVFTLERPNDEMADYSTVYFGVSDDFDAYGDFFGVSETIDGNNLTKDDNAFVLLDNTYSTEQVISVASHELEHILFGASHSADGVGDLSDYAAKTYMLSTKWNQRSPYNKYCPIDPVTKERCATGCTNTAAAQIIYYWIENGMLDLSLTVSSSNSYTSYNWKSDVTIHISDDASTAARYGYLSFDATNAKLNNFKLGNNDSIAALCWAAGIVQQANYSSSGTGASWDRNLFILSGFKNTVRHYWDSNYFYSNDRGLNHNGYELLVDELLAGRPVGASIEYAHGRSKGTALHAIVIDGYDSSTDKFHANFGWGGESDGWYSLNELNYTYGINYLVAGIKPKVSPRLKVTALSFTRSVVNDGDTIEVNFDITNTGKESSTSTTAYIYYGKILLNSVNVSYISPGCYRSLSCTIDTSLLNFGTNILSVQVNSQNEDGSVNSKSAPVKMYYDAVKSSDDTWQGAQASSDTKTTVKYFLGGKVQAAKLASDEYVGYFDSVDFREVTINCAGIYTMSLFESSAKLELVLCKVGANNKLTEMKKITVAADKTGGEIANVFLDKGTYYVSVKALNWKSHGDSDYQLVISGKGFTNGDNSDDWTDVKTAGAAGAVGGVGAITAPGTVIGSEWVGYSDAVDYKAFTLDSAAKLSFTVSASDAAKFTIYALNGMTDKKGVTTYTLTSKQATSLAKPKGAVGYSATTKELLLDKGTYYIAVQSTNAAKGGDADYSVELNAKSVFFTKGDNSDDWTDVKTAGAAGAVGGVGALTAPGVVIGDGWVGYGDAVDYKSFTLDSAAKLSFTVSATDAAKFTIYALNGKTDKKGVTAYTLTSKQATALAKPKGAVEYSATTKELLLDKGTYYIAVQSTNAAKGGDSDYAVALNAKSVFFTKGDNSDDWMDVKTAGAAGAVGGVGTLTSPGVVIDDGWVGFGDEYDYQAFTIEDAAKLVWNFSASDAAKFTVNQLVEKTDKKGVTTYSLKAYVPTTVKAGASATTKELLLEAGTYYIGVQSTNAGKSGANAKGGDANYTVALTAASEFYTAGDNSDDTWDAAPALAAGDAWNAWVGFGDKIDWRALTTSENGGFYDFALLGVENNIKLTVYRVDSKTDKKGVTTYSLKSVKSVTATAKKPTVSTGDLCLAADTRYVVAVEAPDAAKAKNSNYTVTTTEKAVFTNRGNETWDDAVKLDDGMLTGDGFGGILTTAADGDKLDYFDLSEIGSLALDAELGKVKVSFFNGNKKAVKVAEMTMADGSVKKNVSTLTLVADNKTTDSFSLADVGDAVKYLKIEAATSGVNTYKLSLIA